MCWLPFSWQVWLAAALNRKWRAIVSSLVELSLAVRGPCRRGGSFYVDNFILAPENQGDALGRVPIQPDVWLERVGEGRVLVIRSQGPFHDLTCLLIALDGQGGCAEFAPNAIDVVWETDLGKPQRIEVTSGKMTIDRGRCDEGSLGLEVGIEGVHPLAGEAQSSDYYSGVRIRAKVDIDLNAVSDGAPGWVSTWSLCDAGG